MTFEEALKQPFDEYMAWCRNFVTDLVAKNPAVKYVIEVGEPGGMNVLEAG